jgi:hypothetical protein
MPACPCEGQVRSGEYTKLPLLISLPLIMLLAFCRLRPVSLVRSVDRRSFTLGVPVAGQVLILSPDPNMVRSLTTETILSATVLSGGE